MFSFLNQLCMGHIT